MEKNKYMEHDEGETKNQDDLLNINKCCTSVHTIYQGGMSVSTTTIQLVRRNDSLIIVKIKNKK